MLDFFDTLRPHPAGCGLYPGLVIDFTSTATGRASHLLVALTVIATGTLDFSISTATGAGNLPGAATSSASMSHFRFLLSLIFFVIPTVTAVVHSFLMECTISLAIAVRIIKSASCANILCHIDASLF